MSSDVLCTYATGQYGISGDNSLIMDNGKHRDTPSKRKVILVRSGHGSDGTGVGPLQAGAFFEVTRALADADFTIYSIDAGGPNNWWSPRGMTAMTAAGAWVKSTWGVTKYSIFGGSMGGGQAIQAAKTPAIAADLVGVATISAPVDLDYANGTPGYTTPYTYDTTQTPTFGDWSGTVVGTGCRATDSYNCTAAAWTTTTAGHRIHDEVASWRGLAFPISMWHGTLDQVVPYNQAAWWVGQVNDPNVELITLPGAFHTPPTPPFLGPPTSDYIDFFKSLAWPT